MTTKKQQPGEALLGLISSRKWDKVKLEAKRNAMSVHLKSTLNDFYSDQNPKMQQTRILPIHQAIKYGAPVEVLELFHDINKEGVTKFETPHNRVALHICCIFCHNDNDSGSGGGGGDSANSKIVAATATATASSSNASTTSSNSNTSGKNKGIKSASSPIEIFTTIFNQNRRAIQHQDILGRLPIHYALKHVASEEIVMKLIDEYPKCLTVADTNGWLPIHVACRVASPNTLPIHDDAQQEYWIEVIKYMLLVCPHTVHKTTTKGLSVLQLAKSSQNQKVIDVVEHFVKNINVNDTMEDDDAQFEEVSSISHTLDDLKL